MLPMRMMWHNSRSPTRYVLNVTLLVNCLSMVYMFHLTRLLLHSLVFYCLCENVSKLFVASLSADVDAIDALQQASSSLQSVSLSSNHGDEEAGADVPMQQDESEETTLVPVADVVADIETATSEGGLPRSVITTTLYSGVALEDSSDQSSSVDPEPAAGGWMFTVFLTFLKALNDNMSFQQRSVKRLLHLLPLRYQQSSLKGSIRLFSLLCQMTLDKKL